MLFLLSITQKAPSWHDPGQLYKHKPKGSKQRGSRDSVPKCMLLTPNSKFNVHMLQCIATNSRPFQCLIWWPVLVQQHTNYSILFNASLFKLPILPICHGLSPAKSIPAKTKTISNTILNVYYIFTVLSSTFYSVLCILLHLPPLTKKIQDTTYALFDTV